MKKLYVICLSLTIFFGGCKSVKNANNTQKGAAIGAVAGAVIGGVLGNNVGKGGNGAAGAVLGGVIGGVAGGVIGNKMDKQAREIETALPGAEVERVGEGIRLVLGEKAVRFNVGKATLTAEARANLDKIIKVFQEYPDTNINIYGHTDSTGSMDLNMRLSQNRAIAVRDYLVSKGLQASRFTTLGIGPNEPIATNDTPEGRSQNRRVEFSIRANEKMIKEAEQESKK